MLPLTLPRDQVEILLADTATPGTEITIDLEHQKVIRPNGEHFTFEIDEFRKYCLINGLDKIGLTLQKEEIISKFETLRSVHYPWLDGASFKVPDNVPMYPAAEFWNAEPVAA